MRTKKIIALMLCIVMLCLSLVSCEEEIGAWLDKYDWEPEVIAKVQFDLYIIVEDGTDEVAKITVNDKINQYLEDKFNTLLNIEYVSADDYAGVIDTLANPVAPASSATIFDDEVKYGGKIVLINGEQTYNKLRPQFDDLNGYLDYKEFVSLNTQITETILHAAKESNEGATHLYALPNEHVIGEYEYLIINRNIAEYQLHYSAQSELLDILTLEDAAELISDAALIGKTQDEVVKLVKGSYEDKAKFEAEGWICNISSYPEVTMSAVLESAFGVIAEPNVYVPCDVNEDGKIDDGEVTLALDYTYRAMQVLYSINADKTFRNLLQYGVENTNYQMKNGVVVPLNGEGSEYNMNLKYTGDIFAAYYCEGIWTPEMKANGEAQNKEAVLP